MHQRLMAAMEVDDLGEGPTVMKEWVEGLTSQEVVDKLVPASIPVAPVLQINQAIDDPHVKARGIIAEIDHATAGKVRMPQFPVKMSKSPASIRMGAPKLGEHSAEVLKEYLGYTDEQIAELKSSGTVI
jgi:crotonobetainyl-CoA:carnitine CoA-transferase CaiB-like acyl-CoA transferase